MRLSFISLAVVATLLAACSSTPPMTAKAPVEPAKPVQSAQAPQPAQPKAMDQAQLEAQRLAALRQQMTDLSAKSVFFDFDDYSVKPDYTSMLQQQADFLKAQGKQKLTLQGNSDERGGVEYNLALGQKRADAVRKALGLLGAPIDRIEATSFGEERPRATCHEESCWTQNRRVDFVYAGAH